MRSCDITCRMRKRERKEKRERERSEDSEDPKEGSRRIGLGRVHGKGNIITTSSNGPDNRLQTRKIREDQGRSGISVTDRKDAGFPGVGESGTVKLRQLYGYPGPRDEYTVLVQVIFDSVCRTDCFPASRSARSWNHPAQFVYVKRAPFNHEPCPCCPTPLAGCISLHQCISVSVHPLHPPWTLLYHDNRRSPFAS